MTKESNNIKMNSHDLTISKETCKNHMNKVSFSFDLNERFDREPVVEKYMTTAKYFMKTDKEGLLNKPSSLRLLNKMTKLTETKYKKKKRTSSQIAKEDEFYKSVKLAGVDSKKNKKGLFEVPCFPPMLEPDASNFTGRKVDLAVIKNRGLTRDRDKKTKNPRKRYCIRYENAKIKSKGQVQLFRQNEDFYKGEKNSIKAKETRSTILR